MEYLQFLQSHGKNHGRNKLSTPIGSMYMAYLHNIFTYIYLKNVGEYTTPGFLDPLGLLQDFSYQQESTYSA